MLRIRYKTLETPFHYPFRTAHGMKTAQPALLIAIEMNGIIGVGEAPAIHYYDVRVEDMIEKLIQKTPMLERYAFTEPERFWHFCHHLFPSDSFLVCALDMAYWDLFSKMKRKPLWQLWNLAWDKLPLTNYTLGMDTVDKVLQKMNENPWPIYKIKVGGTEDLQVLQTLRKHSNAEFRIDANAGWTLPQALDIVPQLADCRIECIEQPLAKDCYQDMVLLKQELTALGYGDIPLLADESCVSENDVALCAQSFDGINIKLTKCSGITPALRMIQEARALGLKVMMGNMNETEIGTAAMLNFLPLLDYADLDGPLLLDTPLKRIRYEAGKIDWL